ncbi:MAG: NAD-dependent epimerase/dehydratase family protein [Candidatus Delongbacteria bacterium]|nr:NAD-dependent epimerase/dehydratase family protein [Candidatus Delongbacteria bacterium]
MRILITGGLGFIGSNLAIRLTQMGHSVTIIDAGFQADHGWNDYNIAPIRRQVDVIRLNMAVDYPGLERVIHDRSFDLIYDFAGQINHISSLHHPRADLDHNFLAHLNLLEAIKTASSKPLVIFLSTRQIYGRPRYLPVNEKHPVQIVDNNAIHKIMTEEYLQLYRHLYRINHIILRISNIFGPRQYIKDNRQGFIGYFLGLFLKNEPVTIFGDGQQKRDFLYIDDLVDLVSELPFKPDCLNRIYNVGSGIAYTINDFIVALQAIDPHFTYQYKPFPELYRKIDIGDYISDIQAITADSGWKPRMELEQGLRQTITYYRTCLEEYR